MTSINDLPETTTLAANDQVPIFTTQNYRTRQIAASDMATYFKSVFSIKAVQFKTSTSVITITLNDGSIITGTVVP
jgi:hypothetical protein